MLCRAVVCAVVMIVATGVAHAQSSTRAVVWLRGDGDAELLERVRGQVADLDVELVAVEGRPARPGRGREHARALGREHGADIVIWFRATESSTSVYLADLTNERLLVREIEHEGDDRAMARSAALEAAAMVVRSSVRALIAGGTIGVRDPEPRAAEPVAAEVRPPPPPPPLPATEPGFRAFAAVGWSGAFLDTDSQGHHGLAGGFGIGRDRWRVGVAGSLGVGVDYDDPMTTIRVGRTAAALRADRRLWGSDRAELGANAGAGVAVFSRSTLAAIGVDATAPSRTWSPMVSGGLHVRLRAGGLPFAVELSAAADVLLSPPEFGYQLDGAFVSRNHLWPVSPRLGALLVVESL